MRRATLSLVLPLRNEAEGLKDLETHLSSWLSAYGVDSEIILVDDGSTDGTGALLEAWAARDGRVKVISLLRRYGVESALRAGLDHAAGEAIVLIDGDVQDSAEVIPRMVESWRSGVELVHARRKPTQVERGPFSWLRRALHDLTDGITRTGVPQDAGNFRLVDSAVVTRLQAVTSRSRNLRGLLGAVARNQASVTFESLPSKRRPARTLLAEVDDAFESVTRKSLVPIRLAYVTGLALFAVSLFVLGVLLLVTLFGHQTARSWLWLTPVIGIVGSLQLFFLGVVGEYVGRAFLDLQKLPAYTLASRNAVRERAEPAAPRLALPSETESLSDAELEPMPPAAARSETPPPPPPRPSLMPPGESRPPPPLAAPARNSSPPPRLSPAPGQVRAVSTQNTARLGEAGYKPKEKTEATKLELTSTPLARQDTMKLSDAPKADAKPSEPKPTESSRAPDVKPVVRPSNPPLPSRRASIHPVKSDPPAAASIAPSSFGSNAQQPIDRRTKTLAGIPLPAMMAMSQPSASDSKSPPPDRGCPLDRADRSGRSTEGRTQSLADPARRSQRGKVGKSGGQLVRRRAKLW